jgi:hypothetical protein
MSTVVLTAAAVDEIGGPPIRLRAAAVLPPQGPRHLGSGRGSRWASSPGSSPPGSGTGSAAATDSLYNLLEQRGELVRGQLPGGATGYRLASPQPQASTSEPATA